MVPTAPDTRRRERRRAWLIGLALLVCYSYFYYLGGNWNVGSHYAQVLALAEDHTLAIDHSHHLTGDKAFYRGHYYSDKLLGPALLAAPAYLAAKPLAGLLARAASPARRPVLTRIYALDLANLLTNALPTALFGALLYLFLAHFGLAAALRAWLAFTYGFGTLALPYATALFGHNLGAVCVGGAFMLLWRQRQEWRLSRGLAAGALLGLGAICDFTTLFLAAFLGLYALWVARGPRAAKLASAGQVLARIAPLLLVATIPVALQLGANWASFGSPLVFPHVHHVQAAFRARHTRGLLGVHLPQLLPFWQLTFGGHRGLFHGSPVLLLALPGFFLLGKRYWPEAGLFAAAWLGVALLSSGYENWEAGSAYGPRYQIPTLPLLIFAVATTAKRWPLIFKSLATLSMAFMFIVTAHTPSVPESLPVPLAAALGAFSLGRLDQPNLGLALGLGGLTSLLPLLVAETGLLLALFLSLRREPAGVPEEGAVAPRPARRAAKL